MAWNKKLGEILVDLGVASADAVSPGLGIQNATNGKLGDILVDEGVIAQPYLDAALSVQADRRSPIRRKWLGEILVEIGAASVETINKAVAAQRQTGKRLGQTLLDLGLATETAIKEALNRQKTDDSSLGNLAVRMGLVNEEQLNFALKMQQESGARLGETLVELGHLDDASLSRTLKLQKLIRRGVSIALITTAVATMSNTANAATSGDLAATSSGTSIISVVIPDRGKIDIGSGGGDGATGAGSHEQVLVDGGQMDVQLNGASYLHGATTISATGSGPDGAFQLKSAGGDTVSFKLAHAGDAGGGLSPHQSIGMNDLDSLSVQLDDDGTGSTTDTGNVYFGVVTVMVSPN